MKASQKTPARMDGSGSGGLPTGWRLVAVKDIADSIQYGHTASAIQCNHGPRFLRITDIQDGCVDWNTVPSCDIPKSDIGKYKLVSGDLVFARTGATTGKSYLIGICPETVFASYLIRVRVSTDVDSRYLAAFFQSPDYWQQIEDGKRGIGQPNVNSQVLGKVSFPLAPLPEQHRIVAEIEKQFSRLDEGVAALKRVQANLKRYRAAILKAACEGKLVDADLSKWKRLKLSEIGEVVTGNTPPTSDPENLGNEVPFFKPTDLDAGYNVREARQYLSEKGAKLARILPAGSILVTCIGATIGKTGFARVDCATNQQINAFVVNPKIAVSAWAFLAFTSPNGQRQIKENASATTLPILNKSKFQALEIPLPPLAEQTRIVAEVERRLSVVEELEAMVSANLQRSARLRQAVLQKAFSGEL